MAALLYVCTMEEEHSVIYFLWSEIVSGAEIHCRLLAQYGNSVLPQHSVCEWIEQFRNGHISVPHEEGSRHPSTATTDNDIEHVHDMVLLDDWLLVKWQITCKLVMVLLMKSSTIDLAFIQLVQDGSQNNSQCCINKRAWTSANKIWIAMVKKVTPSWTESSLVTKHYEPECKRQIMEWKHPQ